MIARFESTLKQKPTDKSKISLALKKRNSKRNERSKKGFRFQKYITKKTRIKKIEPKPEIKS